MTVPPVDELVIKLYIRGHRLRLVQDGVNFQERDKTSGRPVFQGGAIVERKA
jgi:hypothetical protein